MYSTKDIRFLQSMYKIGSVFALVPAYNFDSCKVNQVKCRQIKGVILLSFIVIGTVYSIIRRYYLLKEVYPNTHLVLDVLNDFFHIAVATSGISVCLLHQKNFARINNGFQYIDKILGNRGHTVKHWYCSPNFNLSLLFAFYLLLISYVYYVWVATLGVLTITDTYGVYLLSDVFNAYFHYLIFCLIRAFKVRCEDLNRFLHGDTLIKFKEQWTQPVEFLRQIGTTTRILAENIYEFNRYFGWTLVFMCGHSVLELLVCINFLVSNKLKDENDFFAKHSFFTTCAMACFQLLILFSIAISSDSVHFQSGHTVFLCYKLLEKFPNESVERKELLIMASQVRGNMTRFTAAGFFDVNRATFLGILATTTTYLIVIIQYNGVGLNT